MLLDGPPGKKVGLALQRAVFVQHLQGAEQIIGIVVVKGQTVAPVIDEAIFGGEGVIAPIQLGLFLCDGAVRGVLIHLQVDEGTHTVPQLHHATDALFRGGVQVGLDHDAVFPVVHLSVHHSEGVVLHVRVGGERFADFLALPQLRQLRFLIVAVDVPDGVVELVGKLLALDGQYGEILMAVLCAC